MPAVQETVARVREIDVDKLPLDDAKTFELLSTGETTGIFQLEGAGMRRLTREHCDVLVSIPMLGHVASLNAGAAAAVLLFEVQRQRGFAKR